jgi:hypothetical protein
VTFADMPCGKLPFSFSKSRGSLISLRNTGMLKPLDLGTITTMNKLNTT